MINNFLEFINLRDCVEKYGAVAVQENFSWAKSFVLPKIDLDLPVINKKSKIHMIIRKKNPIYIQLIDGTKLFFTHDEFRRIHGNPEIGKIMAVKMLRLPTDNSFAPSQIKSCHIIS
jgi:hypothetical protein